MAMAGEGGSHMLLLLFIFGGLLHNTDSTSCGAPTGPTCIENESSLGVCSGSGECVCRAGYLPSGFGCQDDPSLIQSEISGDFNGEVMAGINPFSLKCAGGPFSMEVTWFKDDKVIPGEYQFKIIIWRPSFENSGTYRCQHHKGSKLSGPFVVSVVDEVTIKPVITGLSEKAAMGMKSKFVCSNTAIVDSSIHYVWKLDGEILDSGEDMHEYELSYSAGRQGESLTCELGVQSDSVTLPAEFSETIPGVKISGKHRLAPETGFISLLGAEVLCEFTDNYPSEDTSGLTSYSWYKDGIQIPSEAGATILVYGKYEESGSYQCAANFKGAGEMMSPPFRHTADDFIGDRKCIKSAKKMLKNGYFSMTIEHKLKDTAVQISEYRWVRNNPNVIHRMTGPTLEINNPGSQFDGTYTVTIYDMDNNEYKVDCGELTAEDASAIGSSKPNLYEKDGATTYLVGVQYVFICESDYHTPGGTYTWFENESVKQMGRNEYQFVAGLNDIRIACQYEFSVVTSEVAETLVKGKQYIAGVIISSNEGDWLVEPNAVGSEYIELACFPTIYAPGKTEVDVDISWQNTMIDDDSTINACIAAVEEQAVSVVVTAYRNAVKPSTPKVTSKEDDGSDRITNEDVVVAVKGDEVTLYCLSQSYQSSRASFRWQKDGVPMDSETGFSIQIASMKTENAGRYTCQILIDDIESDYSTDAKIVTYTENVLCTWASDCDFPNFDNTICLDGMCQCLRGYQLEGRQCLPIPPCDHRWHLTAEKDTCVRVIRKKRMSFSRARDYCIETLGGDLVTSVTSRKHRVFMTKQVTPWTQFWIGVHSPSRNVAVFEYVNEEPVSGRGAFKRGRPKSNSRNYCVSMKKRVWYDKNCRRRLPFACQRAANNI